MALESRAKYINKGNTSSDLGYTSGSTIFGVPIDSSNDILLQGMTLLNDSGNAILYLHIWDGTNFTLLDACNHSNGSARFTLFPVPIRIKKTDRLFASTAAVPSTSTPAASVNLGANFNYIISNAYNNTN